MELLASDMAKCVLFTYEIAHLTHTQKIRFFYELHGRDRKKGVLEQMRVEKIAKSVVLVPQTVANEFTQFLKRWQCQFTARELWQEVQANA